MSGALLRGLAGVARALRRQHAHAGTRAGAIVVALGTFLACMGALGAILAVTTVDLRTERSAAASPVLVDSEEDAQLLYYYAYSSSNDRPVTIGVIEPLSDDAPLPPGVEQWPEPGQAVVSPQLAAELTGDAALNYGQVVGTIDPAALESPAERRVYMRPAPDALQAEAMFPASGFGVPMEYESEALHGVGYLYGTSKGETVPLALIALSVTGLITVAAGACVGAQSLRRDGLMFMTIGLQRRHMAIVDALEHLWATLIGAAAAGVVLAVACLLDISIPFLDTRYLAADTRSALVSFIVALLAAWAVVNLALILARAAVRRLGGRRRVRTGEPNRSLASSVCLFAMVAAVSVPQLWPDWPEKTILCTLAGAVVAVTAWAPITACTQMIGAGLARVGLRRRSPGSLVGGRVLQRQTVRSRRLATGVCAAVIMAGFVQLWVGSLGAAYYGSVANRDAFGTSVLEVTGAAGMDTRAFVAALPENAGVIRVGMTDQDEELQQNVVALSANCATLAAAELTCPAGEIERVTLTTARQRYVAGAQLADVTVVDVPAAVNDDQTLVLVSLDGRDLNVNQLQTLASERIPGAVVAVRSDWIVSGVDTLLKANWVITLAAVGLTGVFVALAVVVATDARGLGALLAPLGSLLGRPRIASAAAAWSAGVPLLVSGGFGVLAYQILPMGMGKITGSTDVFATLWEPSGAFTVGALALTVLAALVAAVLAGNLARRYVRAWRPGATAVDLRS
ncbi:hypothetical protein [Actinomyces sp. MRS3W]|uniref:hypothetical protein n=1 Tax=Actinomyces sp. MRS3W TaxID=2800796 RepID=UPI0028FDC48B|nr:hypothetical protein [Actinomyces sp. MRS3W]MDU0347670.1 hypothetical protein [Actinomyces sp. MRS3W]